jgi:hypothetical protein
MESIEETTLLPADESVSTDERWISSEAGDGTDESRFSGDGGDLSYASRRQTPPSTMSWLSKEEALCLAATMSQPWIPRDDELLLADAEASRNWISINLLTVPRANGMLPTIKNTDPLHTLTWPSDLRYSSTWRTLRNRWDIRSLEAISPSNIRSWQIIDDLEYGLFPTRKVSYGKIQLNSMPPDDGHEWRISAMIDTSTNTFYTLPEPPHSDSLYHVTLSGEIIRFATWEIIFYLLKPFLEEEICNMVTQAHEDLMLFEATPEYYKQVGICRSARTRIEDYYPQIATSYHGSMYYDRRIDSFLECDDWISNLCEYQRIHLAAVELAARFDNRICNVRYDNGKFMEWTRRTFDEIMMTIKASLSNSANVYCDDWSNILLSFGEGFMKIFGHDGRVTRPRRLREGHFGTRPSTTYDEDLFL